MPYNRLERWKELGQYVAEGKAAGKAAIMDKNSNNSCVIYLTLAQGCRLYRSCNQYCTLGKKATIHQLTTMLATSKNVLFPGHNHLLTTSTDDPTLSLSPEHQRVKGYQYRWLVGDYDLEIGHF